MIVFIAGQPRSGSTLSYNIVREILLLCGSVGVATDTSLRDYRADIAKNKSFILKSHSLDEEELRMVRGCEVKSIITKRNPLAAIASWMGTFGFDRQSAVDIYIAWYRMFVLIKDYSLIIDYEEILDSPINVASRICTNLEVDIGLSDLENICKKHSRAAVIEIASRIGKDTEEAIDIGFSVYHRDTFYHSAHVSSLMELKPEDRISKADIAWIKNALDGRFALLER